MKKLLFYGILVFALLPKTNAQNTKNHPLAPAASVQVPQLYFPQPIIPQVPTLQSMVAEQQ